MNIHKIAQFALVTVAGAATLLSVAHNNCSNKQASTEEDPVLLQTDSIDLTKPNLPVIGENFIQYRGLDGKVNKVINSDETAAVYRAIAKMSTKKEPDILEPEEFYSEVQKNINSSDNSRTILEKAIDKQIYKMRLTDLFDKVYKMATAFESDGGSVITVKEYTRIMDTFSKTGKKSVSQY